MKFLGQNHDFDTTVRSIGGQFRDKCLEKISAMRGQIVAVNPLADGSADLFFLTKGGRNNDRSVVNAIHTGDSCRSFANLGYRYPETEGVDDQLEAKTLGYRTPATVAR
ncbi:MAG: hypothetical protein AAB613_01130 [Patescibacteria group bacterium]